MLQLHNEIILWADPLGREEFQHEESLQVEGNIYFDGTLEDEVGFDLVRASISNLPLGCSIFSLANKKEVIGFIWDTPEYGKKGLILDFEDVNSIKEAMKKFANKVKFI